MKTIASIDIQDDTMKSELIIPAILAVVGTGVLIAYGLQLRQRQLQTQPTVASPSATTQTNATAATNTTAAINNVAANAVLAGGNPGDTINVRAQPSTRSSVVQQAPVGDRIVVLGEAQGSDGDRWYYIRSSTAREGWVHGSLVRSVTTAAPASPAPASNSAQVALSSCQQRVERQFQGAQTQVSSGSQGADGAFVVNWRVNTGATGYCRVDANGNVVQYVNVTATSPATPTPSPKPQSSSVSQSIAPRPG